MSDLKDIGSALVRDIDSQADELVQKGVAIGKEALGDLWEAEPELRKRYTAATRMGARGSLRALAGETLPFDYWDNVDAQFANINFKGSVIALRAARKAAFAFLGAILDMFTGLGGPAVKAAGEVVKNLASKIG
jgi:hypothetical protein